MLDKPHEQIVKERKWYFNYLKEHLKEVVEDPRLYHMGQESIWLLDTYIDQPSVSNNAPLLYLTRALAQLPLADLVVFTPDWESARGCRVERDIARDYKVPYITLPELYQ